MKGKQLLPIYPLSVLMLAGILIISTPEELLGDGIKFNQTQMDLHRHLFLVKSLLNPW